MSFIPLLCFNLKLRVTSLHEFACMPFRILAVVSVIAKCYARTR